MIEIKRNSDWKITNYDEILEWLKRNIKEIYQKEDYYYDKYHRKSGKSLVKQFETYENYVNSLSNTIYSKYIDTREVMIDGNKVTYIITANNTFFINTHILISIGNDYLALIRVNKNPNISTAFVELEDSVVLPVIIDSHFCTRFLEYNTFSEGWKFKMMEELGLNYNLPCMTAKRIEDDFVYPTNADIINSEKSIDDLDINVEEDHRRFTDLLTKSCIYGTVHSGDGIVMIPPREGEFFVVKTYIKKSRLKKNQLEIIKYQKAATDLFLKEYYSEKKKEGY